ncbi:MAG: DUF4339 domain-containing protein [Pseudolabrys sp.]
MSGGGTAQWYVAQNGTRNGPVSEAELRTMYEGRRIGPNDLVWCPQFPEWKRAGDVFGVTVGPPPLPSAAANGAPGGLAVFARQPATASPGAASGGQPHSAAWAAFRRYKLKGLDIDERPDAITFSQHNAYSTQRVFPAALLAGMIGFSPIIILPMTARDPLSGLLGGIAMSPITMIVALLLYWLLYRRYVHGKNAVVVRRGTVYLDRPGQNVTLNVADIERITVATESGRNTVVFWDHGIPLHTLLLPTQEDAEAVRNGITAAIALKNG